MPMSEKTASPQACNFPKVLLPRDKEGLQGVQGDLFKVVANYTVKNGNREFLGSPVVTSVLTLQGHGSRLLGS